VEDNRTDGKRGLGELLRDLVESGGSLVRHEVRLAKAELTAAASAVGSGTLMVASGAMLALIGALALVTGIILLPGDQWLRDRYWLAALIVFVITGGIAAWLASRGAALLRPSQLAPDQTVATLKEDKEWLKQQMT